MKNDQYIKTTLKPITEGLVVEPSEVGFFIFGGFMQNPTVGQSSLRLSLLSSLIQNPALVLPVFVRFQKVDQYLTIPVMDVLINGDTVEVHTTEGSRSISIESLIDIVVFKDSSGQPVFLTEFTSGGDLAVEERVMIEIWDSSEKARFGVVSHSNVNDGVKPTMNVDSQIDEIFKHYNEVNNCRIAA